MLKYFLLPGGPGEGGETEAVPGPAGRGGGVREQRGHQPGHLHHGGRAPDSPGEGGGGQHQHHAPGVSLTRAGHSHPHTHPHTLPSISQPRGQDQRSHGEWNTDQPITAEYLTSLHQWEGSILVLSYAIKTQLRAILCPLMGAFYLP